MSQQVVFVPLGGGLDLVSPPSVIPSGKAIDTLNFEPVASGYRRLVGFERYSGKLAPSDATIMQINFSNGTVDMGALVQGSVIYFSATDIYAVVLAPPVLMAGVYASSTATGKLLVSFGIGAEALATLGTVLHTVSLAGPVAGQVGVVVPSDGTWGNEVPLLAYAVAWHRTMITAPTGSGPIGAIFPVKNLDGTHDIWVIRNNALATAAVIFKPSAGGWVAQTPYRRATFDQGGIDARELNLTHGYDNVSGAGGPGGSTVGRWVVESGSWAGGDAAGTLWTNSTTWVSGDYLYRFDVDQALRVVRLTSTPSAPTLPVYSTLNPPVTQWEWIRHNFYGASNLTKTYLVNGVGKALEVGFVGSGNSAIIITEIVTGMDTDTPDHVDEHNNALFLSFPGGSVQFSTPGEPLEWDPITGAGEIAVGSDVTDFIRLPEALGIITENSIRLLYGHDASDYQLELLSADSGGLARTAQNAIQPIYMDNRGIRTISASAAYGNFTSGTISRMVEPLIRDKRRDGVIPTCSMVCRTQDQYWLFFDDETGLIVYMGAKDPAIMTFDLGFLVTCACSMEDEDGVERMFVGSDDGYVYELNKGTSFDGAAVDAYVALAYNAFGAPYADKQIHRVALDLEAVSGDTVTLNLTANFDNGEVAGPEGSVTVDTSGAAGAVHLPHAVHYLDGQFRNLSLRVEASSSLTEDAYTLTGAHFHISPLAVQT